jgi:hypothetical protein
VRGLVGRGRRAGSPVVALLVAAVTGFYAVPGLSTDRDLPVLQAIVGTNNGFDIGLFFPDGARVVTLAPGSP